VRATKSPPRAPTTITQASTSRAVDERVDRGRRFGARDDTHVLIAQKLCCIPQQLARIGSVDGRIRARHRVNNHDLATS
jgi:hypothetical protein